MIRPATVDDRDQMVLMGLAFQADESPYGQWEPRRDIVEARVDQALATGGAFVAVIDTNVVGMIGVIVAEHPMTGMLTGFEVAFYVDPKHRGGMNAVKLVRAAEALAKARGARFMQLGAPQRQDMVRGLFNVLGYQPIEVTYTKEL